MHVRIYNRSAFGEDTIENVGMADAVDRIDAYAGRTIGAYVIGQAHANGRRGKRESAAVGVSRTSYWYREIGTRTFHIEIIR